MSTSTVTRWWWVRHAPVVGHNGCIYGQDDFDCDTSDQETFRFLARVLPRDALWVTSHLKRTHRTAASIVAEMETGVAEKAGVAKKTGITEKAAGAAASPLVEPDLAEQHFGAWQGMTNAELAARRDGAWHRFWLAPAHEAPPGGESFVAVVDRVSSVVRRLSAEHAGRDIVAVTHGGTIRAALAIALDLAPEQALAFTVDNCALTCLNHIAGAAGSHAPNPVDVWSVRLVNAVPRTLL